MPIDHHPAVSGSRNDDVERDLVWLQRKLNVATYHDVDDVRCAVIVLKRWARMQSLNTSAKKFVGYVHCFLKSAHIIQRAYRRYKFRRSRLLERHRIKWTSTWSHMLTEEADRHRADTRKLLTDAYKQCTDALPWKAGDASAAASDGGERDMGEIKTLFDGALKMATSSTSQYEVDALCLMEAIMASYQEAIIRFRYKFRALRTNNSAYFEAVSCASNVLILSALRKEGDVVTSPLASGREFPVVFFDDYGAKVSRLGFDSILNSLNLFTDSLGNFTETRARYDVVVFANAVRDLGRALGDHSTESVRFLLGLANKALDSSVRAAPLPAVPLRRLTNSMFPELRAPLAKDDGSPPPNRPMVKRLSAYSMRHFVKAAPVERTYPPSDDDDDEGAGGEEEDGPFARTVSEKRRARELAASEKWEALYEALPVAGPFREKVPWTARLQAYSRLRRAKLILGEKSIAAAAAARTPSKGRRRSSALFIEGPSPTTPSHHSGAVRRASLNSSQHSDISGGSVRRSSLIPVGSSSSRKLPPNRALHDDSPSFQFGSAPANHSDSDEDGVGTDKNHIGDDGGSPGIATRVPSKRSRRPSSHLPQAVSHKMTSFLERHARIHSTRSLMEKKAIGKRMNGVVWKGRGQNSNITTTSPLRSSSSPAPPIEGFRPASPWGVPRLRYDARGPQCRVLPHSTAKRVADAGRGALDTSLSSSSKRSYHNNNPPPQVSLDNDDFLASIASTTTPNKKKSTSTTSPPRNRSLSAKPTSSPSSSPKIRPLSVADRKKVVATLIKPRPTTTPLVPSDTTPGTTTTTATTPLRPVLSEGLFTSSYARELLNNSYPTATTNPTIGSPSMDASSRPGTTTGLTSRLRPVDIQHRKLGYNTTTASPSNSKEVADRIRTSNPRWNSPHRAPSHESPAIYTGLNWHAMHTTPPPTSPSSMLLRSTPIRPSPATPDTERVRQAYLSHIKSL